MQKRDHKLIYLLSENARHPVKSFSSAMGWSPQRLKYMVDSLKAKGILKHPHCVFDYSFFGLLLFRAYFRGGYADEKEKGRVIGELVNNNFITSVYELNGDFDLVAEFASQNPTRFNREFKRLSDIMPTLNDYKLVLNIDTYMCPKYYMIEGDLLDIEVIKIGADREKMEFSNNEMGIMKGLLVSPTSKLSRMAFDSGMNSKTANSILRKLSGKNVIRGFKYVVDTNKAGIHKHRMFLRLHGMDPDTESQLMKYLLYVKEIVQINKTIGDWDMELDVESTSKGAIRGIKMDLWEKFRNIIERATIMEFYDEYKRSYIPAYLFS